MSEWDCVHGRSDDAQTPCPVCAEQRRISEEIDSMDLHNYAREEMRKALTRIAKLETTHAKEVRDAYDNGYEAGMKAGRSTDADIGYELGYAQALSE